MADIIVLDFSECTSAREMHEIIKKVFSFPDYYGHNLDALHDMLSERYTPGTFPKVKILGKDFLPDKLSEYCASICSIISSCSGCDKQSVL